MLYFVILFISFSSCSRFFTHTPVAGRVSFFNLAFERDHTKNTSRTLPDEIKKKLFSRYCDRERRTWKGERKNVFRVIFLQTFIILNTFMSAARSSFSLFLFSPTAFRTGNKTYFFTPIKPARRFPKIKIKTLSAN